MALSGSRHPRAKLDDDAVEDIRWRYSRGGETYQSLADEYGVEAGTISAILRGKTWQHITGGEPVMAPPRGLDTHCARGHEFTPQNIIWTIREDRPRPTRSCRKCKNVAVARASRRRRGNFR